jgi:two-component system chemotaxis response regulator CheB
VDDSALARQTLVDALNRREGLTVAVASDLVMARTRMRQARPDVILLDLDRLGLEGLSFFREVMAEERVPVVICSEATGRGAYLALQAMDEGAIAVVARPRPGAFDSESARHLTEVVCAAAASRLAGRPGPRPRAAGTESAPMEKPLPSPLSARLVAIGASIGGIQALRTLLEAMPPASPGFVIVQHLPDGFSTALAARLDETCLIDVKEARDGDSVSPGCALLAPGNRHLVVEGGPDRYTVALVPEPRASRHRPSVDVLFGSIARNVREHAVGVILSGMGEDGAAGLLQMRQAGAATLAQDEESCAVFGMPRRAIESGAVEEVLPLPLMAGAILRLAS